MFVCAKKTLNGGLVIFWIAEISDSVVIIINYQLPRQSSILLASFPGLRFSFSCLQYKKAPFFEESLGTKLDTHALLARGRSDSPGHETRNEVTMPPLS